MTSCSRWARAGGEPPAVPVAEQGHRLGGAHQQVRGEPPGGQHAGQVLGGGALVAQQPQVPGGLAERVGDLAEVEQTGVRVGGVREPAEQHGQQGALDGGLAAHAGRQRLQVAQGGGRVGVPEGDQPLPGRLRAEPGLTGGERGDGVEQRPVEQLLVQPPYDGGVPPPLAGQGGDRFGAQSQGAAQAAQVGLVLGDEVGAAQPVQLDAVLQGAQEAVGVVELGGVRAADVAAGGEGLQRVEGGAAAQGGVGAAVHQLQQLHGELDVPQAAGAELELAVDLGDGDVRHDPAAHLLHVGDEVLPLGGLPHQRLQRGDVLLAEREVAGHRAGLEQRLELPGLGPALVVGEVGGEGAHERPVAALRPQVGVHGPDGALDGGLGADPHQVRGEPGRGAQRLVLVGPVRGLGHEDDVDVGHVVELVSPALAHRDHREPAQRGVLGRGGPGEGEGGAQGGGGEVGELGGGLGDLGGAAHVPGGDGQQTAPVGDAERDRVVGAGQTAFELLDARVQVAGLVGDEGLPVARVPDEVLGEGGGGAEHAEQPVPQRLGGDDRVQQLLAGGGPRLRLQQPREPEQREVGVGGGAEGLQQYGVGAHGRQLGAVQQPLGGGGVGEAVPQQSGEGTAPAPRRRRHPRPPSCLGSGSYGHEPSRSAGPWPRDGPRWVPRACGVRRGEGPCG
ncbi:hypothetical protein SGRIM128S_00467 [Streptomyces griseomycini]